MHVHLWFALPQSSTVLRAKSVSINMWFYRHLSYCRHSSSCTCMWVKDLPAEQLPLLHDAACDVTHSRDLNQLRLSLVTNNCVIFRVSIYVCICINCLLVHCLLIKSFLLQLQAVKCWKYLNAGRSFELKCGLMLTKPLAGTVWIWD